MIQQPWNFCGCFVIMKENCEFTNRHLSQHPLLFRGRFLIMKKMLPDRFDEDNQNEKIPVPEKNENDIGGHCPGALFRYDRLCSRGGCL